MSDGTYPPRADTPESPSIHDDPKYPCVLKLPLDQIQQEAQPLVESICDKHSQLRDLNNNDGINIQKRWQRTYKAARQRINILKRAHPNIQQSRQIPAALAESSRAAYWIAHLYPAINIEDLIKDDVALHFISSHATTDPCELVHRVIDYTGIDLTRHQEPQSTQDHRMAFRNKRTAEDYGKIIAFDTADQVYDFYPNIGLLVLEIQDHIYSFLLNLSNEMLKADPHTLTDTGPMEDIKSLKENEWRPSLTAMSVIAPYSATTTMDLEEMVFLVETESQAKIEELAAMRESPRYFLELICERRKFVQQVPVPEELVGFSLNGSATNSLVYEAYATVFFWKYTDNIIKRIKACKDFGTFYNASGELTRYCMTLFQLLERWSAESLESSIDSFQGGVDQILRPEDEPLSPLKKHKSPSKQQKHSVKRTDAASASLRTLAQELADARKRERRGMGVIIADIQDVLDKDTGVTTQLDQFILRQFGQITLAAELQRLIRLMEPLGHVWRRANADDADFEYKPIFERLHQFYVQIPKHFNNYDFDPKDPQYEYRPNAMFEESKARRARVLKQFDDMWEALDRHLGHTPQARTPKEQLQRVEEAFVHVQYQAHWLRKDPDYQSIQHNVDEDEESEEVEPQQSPVDQGNTLRDTLQRLDISTGASITPDAPKRIPRVEPRKKVKTRGTADPEEDAGPQEPAEPEEQPRDKIKVSQRVFETLQIAFNAHKGKPPGEIEWNDVVLMMIAMGFTPRQTGGKTFHFNHADPAVAPHTLHGPHPSPKMAIGEFRVAMTRIKGKYNWFEMDSFELKEKNKG